MRTPASVGMPIGIPIGIPMKHCGYHGIFCRRILQLFKVALENGPFIVGLPITMVIFDSYVSWPKDDMWVCLQTFYLRPYSESTASSSSSLFKRQSGGCTGFPPFSDTPNYHISRWLSISLTRMHISLIHYVSIISHDIHDIFQLQSDSHIFVHHGWLTTSYKVG